MKTIILALLIIPLALFAQQSGPVSTPQPNCVATDLLPEAGQTVAPFNMSRPFDNRIVGCTDFTLTVEVPTTISALSLVLQTAPDNGSGAPGTWSTFTAATGSNPNTLTSGWTATFTTGTSAYFAWLRVQLTSMTGTGQVRVKFFSSIAGGGSGGGSGGCAGTVGTPCVVDGPTAVGSAVTLPPVQMGGQDANSGTVTNIQTDANGALLLGNSGDPPQADGTIGGSLNMIGSPVGPGFTSSIQTVPFLFNGTTWDRARGNAAGGAFVQGPTAAGSAPAGAPVQIAGFDGTNVQRILTNVRGATIPAAVVATPTDSDVNTNETLGGVDGSSGFLQTPRLLVRPFVFNGSTWDRQFICPSQALITLADATLTAVVPVSGATIVRVCSVHVTTGTAETVSLLQGTGVACSGSPVTIDAYLGVTAFVTDYTPSAALRTSASNGLCVQQSGAAQAAKVWVSYAQF